MKSIKLKDFKKEIVKDFTISCSLEEIEKYLKYIGKRDYITRYPNIGFILKNLNHNSLPLYIEWCKQSKKYNEVDVNASWKTHKALHSITISSLMKYIKVDKIKGYETIISDDDEAPIFKSIKINERFLSNSKVMCDNLDTWLTGDDKFLCVKSPYGTGKTVMLKYIFNNYDISNMKVLFITYRRTLAFNTAAVFTEYNFKNYLDGVYCADKQIIQLDSIEKLEKNYDFIIIDEIESVLWHLTGETIAKTKSCLGNSEYIHNLFKELINNASKVICMDGDYNNRSHTFLSSFNQNVKVIENTIKFDGKEFEEYYDKKIFDEKLHEAIDENNKIVIVCMSADTALKYYIDVNETRMDKKVYIYTSKTGDKEKKEDFKDVNKTWINADIVIYSPTIESGVDFNVEHFDKLFIVYSQFSTSPRGLFQMMNRIRHYKYSHVDILFEKVPSNGIRMTFKEMSQYYMGVVKRELTDFDKIYVYNLLEEYDTFHRFYKVWMELVTEKGHTIKKNDCANIEKKKKIPASASKNYIIYADKITDEEYENYNIKQKSGEATTDEKWSMERYIYCKIFCDDDIEEIIEHFYNKKYIMDNHICVVDPRNIKFYNYKDNDIKDFNLSLKVKKIECVRNIIFSLGFSNCYDKKKLYSIISTKTVDYITEYYKLMNDTPPLITSIKNYMGAINGILHHYGLKIMSNDTTKKIDGKKKKVYYYTIHPEYSINIYVQKRINIGKKIYDADKIFKPLIFDF